MAVTFTINGSNKTSVVRRGSLDIRYTFGQRATARFAVRDTATNTATAYRPTPDLSVSITDGATTIFAGTIIKVTDRAIVDPKRGVETVCECVDVSRALTQRLVNITHIAGFTLNDLVTSLDAGFLDPFGLSIDPGMAAGPTLDAGAFDYVTTEGVFNFWADLTGWMWRVLPTGVVQWFEVGDETAPYSLTSSNAKIVGGVEWSKTLGKKVNTQIVRYGDTREVPKTQIFDATAGQTNFVLDYTAAAAGGNLRGYITVNGVFTPLGVSPWSWDAANNRVVRSSGATIHDAIEVTYDAQFPQIVTYEDTADSGAHGKWEDVINLPDVFDKDAALAQATALVRRYKTPPRIITVRTRETPMPYVGDVITLTISERTISGDWLIQEVGIRDLPNATLMYDLTCLEGTEAQASWVEYFRNAFGSSSTSSSGGTITGALLPASSATYTTDVIANVDTTGKEAKLTTYANSATDGPALQLGRGIDPTGWVIVGDNDSPSPDIPRLRFVSPLSLSAAKFHAQFYIQHGTVDGCYLTPDGDGSGFLDLGGPAAVFGAGTNHFARYTYTKDIQALNGVYERNRTFRLGAEQPTTFNAANYLADTGSHWTLTSPDQETYSWDMAGTRCDIIIRVKDSTITNTPTYLKVATPGGVTFTCSGDAPVRYKNGGTWSNDGIAIMQAGEAFIRVYRDISFVTTWANDTNDCFVRFELFFYF